MVTAQGRRSLLIAHDRLYEETAVEVKSKYWWTNRVLRISGGADRLSHVMRGGNADTPQSARGQNKLGRKERFSRCTKETDLTNIDYPSASMHFVGGRSGNFCLQ